MLRLPVPSTDLLGRPVWEVSEEEVSRSSPCESECTITQMFWLCETALFSPTPLCLSGLGSGRAYRKLARFCHPDKMANMDEEDAVLCEKAYAALGKAKKVLSTENERGPYVREWLREEEMFRARQADRFSGRSRGCVAIACTAMHRSELD